MGARTKREAFFNILLGLDVFTGLAVQDVRNDGIHGRYTAHTDGTGTDRHPEVSD